MQLAKLEPAPNFNCIQKFLKEMDIPVPDILRFDAERGLLFLMDCGDTHLVDKIEAEPKNIVYWYQKAIEIIVAFHTRATENLTPDCPAKNLFFDEENDEKIRNKIKCQRKLLQQRRTMDGKNL